MASLNKEFFQFFKELSSNNHKDWFDEHRKRYHKVIKLPFEAVVNDLIAEVNTWDESIEITHKEAVFRINRDIRFSKDKTPYKTDRTAIISKYGRKNKTYPGFYLFVSPEKVMVGGGAYFLEKEQLFKVRQEIAYNLEEFNKIITHKSFVRTFESVRGDKNKVAPKEFKEDINKQPLLLNKGFYFMKDLPTDIIMDDDGIKKISTYLKDGLALNQFLRRALD